MSRLADRKSEFLKYCGLLECQTCRSDTRAISTSGFETENQLVKYSCTYCDTSWHVDVNGNIK